MIEYFRGWPRNRMKFTRTDLSKKFTAFSFLAMAALLYRLETYDLLILWVVTFLLVYFLRRFILFSFLVSSVVVAVYVGLFFCLAVPPVDKDRYDGFVSGLRAGAHRGLALDAPENTLSAFRLSQKLRADSIEFDLEFTSDNVAVILHDDTVDRTTDGSGRIDQMTWDEARTLNAAAKFEGERKFGNERMPTLEETLILGRQLGFKMFIDVKKTHAAVVPAITKMFKKYPDLYNSTAVCSFLPDVVYKVKRADSNIITGHTFHPAFFTHTDSRRTKRRFDQWYVHFAVEAFERAYLWSLHNWLWKWTGVNLILAHHDSVSSDYIQMWRKRGVQVVAWTVNDLQEKRLYLNSLKCPFLTDRLSDLQDN